MRKLRALLIAVAVTAGLVAASGSASAGEDGYGFFALRLTDGTPIVERESGFVGTGTGAPSVWYLTAAKGDPSKIVLWTADRERVWALGYDKPFRPVYTSGTVKDAQVWEPYGNPPPPATAAASLTLKLSPENSLYPLALNSSRPDGKLGLNQNGATAVTLHLTKIDRPA
ncbi:hypothetical protein GCM10022243_22220 [Saccharothrix violaceirubra]|uniref:Uncharacterized protein n=1 Tax=Saccharothrix violaceirubra TaxID=413306 RepID=A0A7W7T2K4_9PSEU|nr:hypothetical protein [Saccharothrix violaceirubra]MBB4964842.1 hypothetical protein [Saccharothrix violaceirubra]